MDKLPLVSVVMITYNHEAYIEEAIRGVLIQNCDFQIEFIISNDKSTDRTADVITKVLQENPTSIDVKVYNHETNKGVSDNFIWSSNQAQGKYIAYCEGDDFWTDPLKLKKQVDFLESNPEYEICFTNCSTVDEKSINRNSSFLNYNKDKSFTAKNLMFVAPTLTRVYRNNKELVISGNNIVAQDALLLIEQMKFGNAKYLDFNSACYRKHDKGIWSLKTELSKKMNHLDVRLYGLDNTEGKVQLNFLKLALNGLMKIKKINEKKYLEKYNEFKIVFNQYYWSLNIQQLVKLLEILDKLTFIPKKIVLKSQLKLISML